MPISVLSGGLDSKGSVVFVDYCEQVRVKDVHLRGGASLRKDWASCSTSERLSLSLTLSFLSLSLLEMDPRTWHILGECFTTELYPQPKAFLC